jgi:hypothetical protein
VANQPVTIPYIDRAIALFRTNSGYSKCAGLTKRQNPNPRTIGKEGRMSFSQNCCSFEGSVFLDKDGKTISTKRRVSNVKIAMHRDKPRVETVTTDSKASILRAPL